MVRSSELVRVEGKKSLPVPAALLYLVAAIVVQFAPLCAVSAD
jgi:hypothetical protein